MKYGLGASWKEENEFNVSANTTQNIDVDSALKPSQEDIGARQSP